MAKQIRKGIKERRGNDSFNALEVIYSESKLTLIYSESRFSLATVATFFFFFLQANDQKLRLYLN